jgi:hypothetical protein
MITIWKTAVENMIKSSRFLGGIEYETILEIFPIKLKDGKDNYLIDVMSNDIPPRGPVDYV